MAQIEFDQLFKNYQQSAYRIETLREYNVPEEKEELSDYLRGVPLPTVPMDEWLTMIRRNKKSGKTIARVHIVPTRLTPYLRYEIEWGYCYTASAGEDIYLLEEDNPEKIGASEDFWIFDASIVALIHYDVRGAVVRIEIIRDPERVRQYQKQWKTLLAKAMPLTDYLARSRNT